MVAEYEAIISFVDGSQATVLIDDESDREIWHDLITQAITERTALTYGYSDDGDIFINPNNVTMVRIQPTRPF